MIKTMSVAFFVTSQLSLNLASFIDVDAFHKRRTLIAPPTEAHNCRISAVLSLSPYVYVSISPFAAMNVRYKKVDAFSCVCVGMVYIHAHLYSTRTIENWNEVWFMKANLQDQHSSFTARHSLEEPLNRLKMGHKHVIKINFSDLTLCGVDDACIIIRPFKL